MLFRVLEKKDVESVSLAQLVKTLSELPHHETLNTFDEVVNAPPEIMVSLKGKETNFKNNISYYDLVTRDFDLLLSYTTLVWPCLNNNRWAILFQDLCGD